MIEQKFRAGSITATIWRAGDTYEISLNRSFRGIDGNWKESKKFKFSDLPKVLIAIGKCYEYIALKGV